MDEGCLLWDSTHKEEGDIRLKEEDGGRDLIHEELPYPKQYHWKSMLSIPNCPEPVPEKTSCEKTNHT